MRSNFEASLRVNNTQIYISYFNFLVMDEQLDARSCPSVFDDLYWSPILL